MPAEPAPARNSSRPSPDGWRGMLLVAATYVYFLIFAQFGFLQRLTQAAFTPATLQPILAAMAAGGILASLASARLSAHTAPRRLRLALLGCAAAAALTLLPVTPLTAGGIALLIGLSLGTLTVTLVANLHLWAGSCRPLLWVGLGTGFGYWTCNIPALFTASPQHIALAAIAAAFAGFLAAAAPSRDGAPSLPPPGVALPFAIVLVWFTALVWLDSAAFFIIQNSPILKAGAWTGTAHLWRTGAIHFLAALAGTALLVRRGTAAALLAAFACLGSACLLLLHPAHNTAAALLYPAGVSLYSVALVAYPSLLSGADPRRRALRAGWIYAVAGWIGSAMGIGMAQHLHSVPLWFVALTAAAFLLPIAARLGRAYWREALAMLLVLAASWVIEHALRRRAQPAPPPTAAQRGRRVYIAEGCINCHSQYVRPHSADVDLWGPATNLAAIQKEKPPLIGNRRQGPDLSNVGARRSPLWLRIHLIDPRAVSPGSIMPSYAGLFRDQSGSDLVAYLSSLKAPDSLQQILAESARWTPPPAASRAAPHLNGAKLYTEYCATCHSSEGSVRRRWGAAFSVTPPALTPGKIASLAQGKTPAELRLERVIKFGLPGTGMPGHEVLPPAQIEAIARYLATGGNPATN